MATNDLPTGTNEPESPPPAAARSCRSITIARRLTMPMAMKGTFNESGCDIAESERFVLPLEDREQHDGGADVGDDQEDLEQRAQRHARAAPAPTM
jgi:hypothetical protein